MFSLSPLGMPLGRARAANELTYYSQGGIAQKTRQLSGEPIPLARALFRLRPSSSFF
jgi:hypothetical protein